MANFQMRFIQNGTCVALDVVAHSPSILFLTKKPHNYYGYFLTSECRLSMGQIKQI